MLDMRGACDMRIGKMVSLSRHVYESIPNKLSCNLRRIYSPDTNECGYDAIDCTTTKRLHARPLVKIRQHIEQTHFNGQQK